MINGLLREDGLDDAISTFLRLLIILLGLQVAMDDAVYDLRCYDRKQWRALVKKSALEYAGSFDGLGQPLGERTLPYQLEVLRRAL